MELTIEVVQALAKIVVDNKLDCLKLEGIEITKAKHEPAKLEKANNSSSNGGVMDGEELLYWSSSSPNFTQEQIDDLAINSPTIKQKRAKKTKDA